MTIDGHTIEPLPNGGCYVITGGEKTLHADRDAALRHVARLAGDRARYEAQRIVEGGRR